MTTQGVEALAVTVSAMLQLFVLIVMMFTVTEMKRASKIALTQTRIQLEHIRYLNCPVLVLRKGRSGGYQLENCGTGPAIMAQWGYGTSVITGQIDHRLHDNVIPAGDSRQIDLDETIARKTGVLLFAYSILNEKFTTKITWNPHADEPIVWFGSYEGKMPNET